MDDFSHFFRAFFSKNTFLIESKIQDENIKCYIVQDFWLLLDEKENLPETIFLSAQMDVLSSFHQMLISSTWDV